MHLIPTSNMTSSSSSSAPPPHHRHTQPQLPPPAHAQHLSRQVLIYNVTHSDLMLGVTAAVEEQATSPPALFVARPRFSSYQTLEDVLGTAATHGEPTTVALHMDLVDDPTTPRGFGGTPDKPAQIPVGFDLSKLRNNKLITPWASLHLRASAPPPTQDPNAYVRYVYLPLAAQLIPAWKSRVESFGENAQTTVLLVSGAGRPQNPSEKMEGNSTRSTAQLIATFLQRFYGMQNIIVVDSGFDVFSMDENVLFVRNYLLARLEEIRRAACQDAPSGEWRSTLEVTMALTEGSPARLAALSAALRPYRPFVAHMWQLKTFWHEGRTLASDVLFHSFDRVDTTPPMPVKHLSEVVKAVVNEIRQYRSEFEACDKSELHSFWLRKSQKPVLSVLCTQKRGSNQRRFFRGINLEVSQPTGSLCSERNAIGSALAEDPTLKRRDLVMIAVLALPRVSSSSSSSANHHTSSQIPPPPPQPMKRQRSESIKVPTSQAAMPIDTQNPLGPCGACNEWLKKIFEVNPDFRIVTFTDESCDYAFVKEVF